MKKSELRKLIREELLIEEKKDFPNIYKMRSEALEDIKQTKQDWTNKIISYIVNYGNKIKKSLNTDLQKDIKINPGFSLTHDSIRMGLSFKTPSKITIALNCTNGDNVTIWALEHKKSFKLKNPSIKEITEHIYVLLSQDLKFKNWLRTNKIGKMIGDE